VAALLGTATAAPQLLAWPYSAEIGHTRIYSETPIPPAMRAVLARSDVLVARSPLAEPGLRRSLFLSQGGWRWDLLALTSRGAFAFRRPFRDAIIVNASDVAADRVENGAPVSYIIDYDKARLFLGRLPTALANRNIARLKRSVLKLDPEQRYFSGAAWRELVKFYHEDRRA